MIKGNTAILLMIVVGLTIASFSFENVQAQNPTKCQTNALIGVGGVIFGVANVCTDGYTINVDLATNYLPKEDWVFNAWLVDDAGERVRLCTRHGKGLRIWSIYNLAKS